jgi:hypothetical protein
MRSNGEVGHVYMLLFNAMSWFVGVIELKRLLGTAQDEDRKQFIIKAMHTLDEHEQSLSEDNDGTINVHHANLSIQASTVRVSISSSSRTHSTFRRVPWIQAALYVYTNICIVRLSVNRVDHRLSASFPHLLMHSLPCAVMLIRPM